MLPFLKLFLRTTPWHQIFLIRWSFATAKFVRQVLLLSLFLVFPSTVPPSVFFVCFFLLHLLLHSDNCHYNCFYSWFTDSHTHCILLIMRSKQHFFFFSPLFIAISEKENKKNVKFLKT